MIRLAGSDLSEEARMTLVEHLRELRRRVVYSCAAVATAAVVAYVLYQPILDLLMAPYCERVLGAALNQSECQLLAISPVEPFSVRLTIATYTGLAFAMPVLLWQVWAFVAPGLYPKERQYGIVFVASSFALFLAGAALAYWTLPRALGFLVAVGGESLHPLFTPKEYIGFVIKMMIGFGIGFEFPIVLIFLQLIELVRYETLKHGRRYALVGIVVLVAILTPSGDPIPLIALSVPMYLFYEISLAFGWWRNKRGANRSRTEP